MLNKLTCGKVERRSFDQPSDGSAALDGGVPPLGVGAPDDVQERLGYHVLVYKRTTYRLKAYVLGQGADDIPIYQEE